MLFSKSPHPRLLPQSPKDCSLHLGLFCCLAYRVIVTIFLNSIYLRWYTVLAKSKGEKERYKHLNAEFQRIARRDKKAFLSNQCKETEENNKMGKIRDLFKKIRDTKGKFQAKIGTIKDRNGMDLTETEDIKKRWQAYTEKLIKKDLHDPDNHDGVITQLEPDILECEVKWP